MNFIAAGLAVIGSALGAGLGNVIAFLLVNK